MDIQSLSNIVKQLQYQKNRYFKVVALYQRDLSPQTSNPCKKYELNTALYHAAVN